MLKIYNTLTATKEKFETINPGEVSLYCCGVTVYANCHIGHARTFIVMDVVVRFLQHLQYRVNYIRNITDIDDKIINKAKKNNQDITAVSEFYTEKMQYDFMQLNLLQPSIEPKATNYIKQMITMIATLVDKKFAYVGADGDVFFDVSAYKKYGELSKRKVDDLLSGARIEANTAKKQALDFVLWKLAKPDEPSWESPWGLGRPGWHIECSAMATDILGSKFDIHGGGHDLQFPHHENECAQAKAATGCDYAKTWMHVGFLQIDKEKMSKSLKNFITIEELLEQYHPDVVRLFLLGGHYRKPLEFNYEALEMTKTAMDRLYFSIEDASINTDFKLDKSSKSVIDFELAMNDDFNTVKAIAVLFNLARKCNIAKQNNEVEEFHYLANTLVGLARILGLMLEPSQNYLRQGTIDNDKIEALIAERESARQAKNWQRADEIRDKLAQAGIIIKDTPKGVSWHRA